MEKFGNAFSPEDQDKLARIKQKLTSELNEDSESKGELAAVEEVEYNEQVYLIHIPRISDAQMKKLDAFFQKARENVYWNYKPHTLGDHQGGFMKSAPRYTTQLLDMGGYWLAATSESSKQTVLNALEAEEIDPLDMKEGDKNNLLREFKDSVSINKEKQLDRTKMKNRWPGSPRH